MKTSSQKYEVAKIDIIEVTVDVSFLSQSGDMYFRSCLAKH
jgi:hypothetical protein